MQLALPSAEAQTRTQTTTKKPAAKSQTSKAPAKTTASKAPAAKAPATKTEPIEMKCPAVLGTGATSKKTFCDVLTGVNPAEGIVMPDAPAHRSDVLTFDLHNRHTYSEAETKAGKAFARYTATVVLANLQGEVLGRATVLSEFRTAQDLVDRVSGGAGPGGVKAVAPTGIERIVFEVPDDVTEVVVLGERLAVQRAGWARGLQRRGTSDRRHQQPHARVPAEARQARAEARGEEAGDEETGREAPREKVRPEALSRASRATLPYNLRDGHP